MNKILFIILTGLILLLFINPVIQAENGNITGTVTQYGGITYNRFELTEINNYIKSNYDNIPLVNSGNSIFAGVSKWFTDKLAVGIEVEHINSTWKNNEIIGARSATTGYLAVIHYEIYKNLLLKSCFGGYATDLILINEQGYNISKLGPGFKLGLKLPVSTESLDKYLPIDLSDYTNLGGGLYLGYRYARVNVENEYVDIIDYSGIEISTSLNFNF